MDGTEGGWTEQSPAWWPSRELFGSLEAGTSTCTETREEGRPRARTLFSRHSCSDARCHGTKTDKARPRAHQRAARFPLSFCDQLPASTQQNSTKKTPPHVSRQEGDLDKLGLLLACHVNERESGGWWSGRRKCSWIYGVPSWFRNLLLLPSSTKLALLFYMISASLQDL